MNANELANLLEVDSWYKLVTREEIATMLRQQADLIRNLQKSLGFKNSGYETINLTPQLELTDEEILSVIKCVADDVSPHKEYENTYSDGWLDACNTVYDEVFAILRKAQEK